MTTLGASLSGNSTINTSPWDLNWPRFFSGTKCTINGNAVAASGYVTSAQLSIAGTTVNQYTDTGTHKTSLSIADTFDSTHFANNALVTYKMTVQDSGGNSYYLTGQGPTLNKGYGVVNTDGDFNPGIAAAVLGNMINYAQSPSAGDSKATINSNLPNYTAFYIATHGNSTGFGDGSIVGGQSPLPYYQQHFIAYQATSPDIGVTNDITVKAANPNLPPYNLVDIDACNSAGNGAAASTGATSFGINSSDRALLGWNAEEYTSNYAWVARVWNNLALGMTLKDAVNAATSKGRPSGPDANNHPVPINGVILGDSATKLHGVYGGAGLAWHLP
ncbi:hypothetical protein CCAX7_000110 [Capsulimonas corticalis]|uniref:Uncharacterized protein n=1 Tax=Capsulimonas corticalis TaxID=2219043 RepID=A0A402CRC5_9BACT|nr:hypothetical protein CCAX7_000110 [Capsulimonas corticalis]